MINVTKTYMPDRDKYIGYANKIFGATYFRKTEKTFADVI